MHLTSYTDYAFRTLIFLAIRREEGSTIAEMAEHYDISRNHLMKVVQQLARSGFVETTRGRGGGVRLGKEPSEIRLGDVMRATEDDLGLVECFVPERNRCAITRACRLRSVLGDALTAFLAVLDGYTLEDMVRDDHTLEQLVRIRRALVT